MILPVTKFFVDSVEAVYIFILDVLNTVTRNIILWSGGGLSRN